MNVQDAMTKDVVTVGPDTTVKEIAALVVSRRISAVPVVAQGNHLVGIVSQKLFLDRMVAGHYGNLRKLEARVPGLSLAMRFIQAWSGDFSAKPPSPS